MKSAVKTQRRGRRGLAATGPVPVARADDERIAEPTAEPDGPAAEAALPFLPAENERPPPTDIERVDEHGVGSVEAAPHPEPEGGITGFVEPTSDADLEPPGR